MTFKFLMLFRGLPWSPYTFPNLPLESCFTLLLHPYLSVTNWVSNLELSTQWPLFYQHVWNKPLGNRNAPFFYTGSSSHKVNFFALYPTVYSSVKVVNGATCTMSFSTHQGKTLVSSYWPRFPEPCCHSRELLGYCFSNKSTEIFSLVCLFVVVLFLVSFLFFQDRVDRVSTRGPPPPSSTEICNFQSLTHSNISLSSGRQLASSPTDLFLWASHLGSLWGASSPGLQQLVRGREEREQEGESEFLWNIGLCWFLTVLPISSGRSDERPLEERRKLLAGLLAYFLQVMNGRILSKILSDPEV